MHGVYFFLLYNFEFFKYDYDIQASVFDKEIKSNLSLKD